MGAYPDRNGLRLVLLWVAWQSGEKWADGARVRGGGIRVDRLARARLLCPPRLGRRALQVLTQRGPLCPRLELPRPAVSGPSPVPLQGPSNDGLPPKTDRRLSGHRSSKKKTFRLRPGRVFGYAAPLQTSEDGWASVEPSATCLTIFLR